MIPPTEPRGEDLAPRYFEFLARFGAELDQGAVRPLAAWLQEFDDIAEEVRRTYALHDEALVGGTIAESRRAPLPTAIGPYRILRELGAGGQGIVYLALDPRLGREVALKVLTQMGAESEDTRRRFEREATVAARLQHPGICAILDAGTAEGRPYIAMRYVRGQTLAAAIAARRAGDEAAQTSVLEARRDGTTAPQRKSRPPTTSREAHDRGLMRELQLFERAARALHVAHEAGVLHRDIKPGNIMIEADGSPVLLDFGLARSDDEDFATLTRTGDFFGTPAYMSPEQLTGQRVRMDRRADIYALGVSLFESLTLQRPFQAPTREALYQSILTQPPPDLRKLMPNAPADLRVVVETAIEKDRDRRYATALAFAEDLERLRTGRPILARPIGPVGRAVRFARREPWLTGLGLCLFFVLTAATFLTLEANRELSASKSALEANASELERESIAKAEALQRERELVREYERAADLHLLHALEREAEKLWPIRPELLPRVRDFERRAAPLRARLADHRRALDELRKLADPLPEARHQEDYAAEYAEIAAIELADQSELIASRSDPNPGRARSAQIELQRRADRVLELKSIVAERKTYEFGANMTLKFRHDTLARLVQALSAAEQETGVFGRVRRRADLAATLSQRSVDGPLLEALWTAAAGRVAADPRFRGLKIGPVFGFLPLGPDPSSKLEEFLFLPLHEREPDASPPFGRDALGRLPFGPGTGPILVLLPGGTFVMGASALEDGAPDPDATDEEGPPHEVRLNPFFCSKFEFTKGQWARGVRMVGGLPERPSAYDRGWFHPEIMSDPIDDRHPIEQVQHGEATRLLRHFGLDLLTEAQWEYAARAQGRERWPGTNQHEEIGAHANLSGEETVGFVPWDYDPTHRDPFVLHAAVGSMKPNAFGLHDLGGNVMEWCIDPDASYTIPVQGNDALRESLSRHRIVRGGAYNTRPKDARTSVRSRVVPETRSSAIGFRAALTVAVPAKPEK